MKEGRREEEAAAKTWMDVLLGLPKHMLGKK